MKKHFTLSLAAMLMCFGIANAQTMQANQIIVVNSGSFETMPPFADYVTVGSYNLSTGTYADFDVIYNQSAQALEIDGDEAFVASEDSIIKYDLQTNTRVAATSFDSVAGYSSFYSTKNILLTDNHVLVGNWYGATDNNIQVYNRSDLTWVQAISGITSGVSDMVLIGDTIYAGQNETSLSTYSDTLGYLAVIDASNFTYVRDQSINTNGENIGVMTVDGSRAVGFNSNPNSITAYNAPAGTGITFGIQNSINSGTTGSQIAKDGGEIFVFADQGLSSVNAITYQFNLNLVTGFFVSMARDVEDDMTYLAETDYSTYGRVYIYNSSYQLADSFAVGVSPESLGVHYTQVNSIGESQTAQALNVYPNPTAGLITLSGQWSEGATVEVYNAAGLLVASRRLSATAPFNFDLTDQDAGIYLLKVQDQSTVHTQRIIKR